MPFPHDSGLVTRSLQKFRQRLLRTIEYTSRIIGEPIRMTVLTRKHTRPTRPT